MKNFLFLFFLFFSFLMLGQEENFIDEKYYEDQFYVGVQYNSVANAKNGINSTGVPYSFEVGFIKDIPLNKRRNMGFGLGLGYTYDILRPNIAITPNDIDNSKLDFNINDNFRSYRYLSHNFEIPLEFRWRTSTATTYSFWRIYTGASFVYSFNHKTEFETGDTTTSYTNIDVFNKTNFTIYTSIGYGTWNFHIKYYINSPFKNTIKTTDNKPLSFNQLKLGVMFYIL